jgi:tetratricopeptide (TPR) repeat protein
MDPQRAFRISTVVIIVTVTALGASLLLPRQTTPVHTSVAEPGRVTPAVATSRASLDAVIGEMRTRVAADPGDGAAAVLLADALMRAARVEADASLPLEAERALRATLSHGNDYAARRMLAAVYLSQHRFREALDLALRAQRDQPEDAWNYATAGDALVELGRYDEAFGMFDKAVARRPDAGSYARIAYGKELTGNLEGALEVMRMAAEATAPQDVEGRAWAQTQLGLLSLQLGRLNEAERAFEHAQFLFPEHPYALVGRIRLAIAREQYAAALELVRRVPSTPETVAIRGDLQRVLGDARAAEASYRESEQLERDGWKSEAPQPAALARFMAERNRSPQEAIALAERAAAERQDIHTLDALAWSYFKGGRLPEAQRAIRRATRTGTADARIRCHAAVIDQAIRSGTVGTCDPLNPMSRS